MVALAKQPWLHEDRVFMDAHFALDFILLAI
jgi:hypothetical protein